MKFSLQQEKKVENSNFLGQLSVTRRPTEMQLVITRNLTNLASLQISNAIMTAMIKTNTQTITMTLVKSIKVEDNVQK